MFSSNEQPRVGFVGLGAMGRPMASNIAQAGFPLTVFNRTSARAEEFAAEHSVEVALTPVELARNSDVIISMLADYSALSSVYAGADGVLAGLSPDAVCVDMSTIGPVGARELATRVAAAGARFIDAPVSGSVAPAERGELMIMAGGASEDLERARPVLAAIGDPILHLGPAGSGQVVKLAINAILHSLNQSLAEALVLCERAGVSRDAAYGAFAQSAIAAPVVHYRREAFERPGEVPVSFRLSLAEKDLDLAIDFAASVGSDLPAAETTRRLAAAAIEAGFGDRDLADVAEYMRGLVQ